MNTGDDKKISDLAKMLWREFDIIAPYLRDETTIEIMLNPDGNIWVEQIGKPMFSIGEMSLYNAQSLFATIAHSMGKTIDNRHPCLEGTLLINDARFEGFYPPVSSAPTFAIRKKPKKIFSLDDFKLTENQKSTMVTWVKERKNILVVGGTSSGKTSFSNAFIDLMAQFTPDDRIVILETLDEIQCRAKNYSKLIETMDVTMNQLLRGVMRYRPDRIIVGEVVDAAALSMLKAWNTGHDGGLCTIHADSALEGFDRLYDLIEESGINMSERVNRLIGRAIDGVVFLKREQGVRVVKEVANVTEFNGSEFVLDYVN
ncbi:P-type conjugative transfer ATPase TrbB [Salmonella enterica]|uniref:P-type conjugative transfer ATPase TrbB n=3 Tax=Enterobacterales TaxID=91347 RepID=A0A1E7Z151_9GAMM|nr:MULTISPECIES: P-type conjugative transfer ATPase TrbB [Enterobacterales]EAP4395326.1 P-type conjugative transfer ATPase TrbB [Salmonella enterica]EDK6638316.1 conjugal transfer protein TrbB [Salmonella enterica subsp. enterica serovar Typhimurium]EDR5596941.1 P-type conjugative transfer ATPase TrbB [Salmonella enterica subsp. diarizonae]EKO1087551.1 P-type conjugative transfer ATPase TrbB [Salmonella enterica subsp. enterica]EKQ4268920.1 P-type conjugative transfer ATPase TrbB [Klebsiella p